MRNADAGVVDLDAQPLAAPPAADQHASRRRIFDRIGNQVLQQPPQQPAIRARVLRARHELQIEALGAGERREFDVEPVQQFVDAELGEFRLHRPGIEPRNVEQRGENLFDRFERGVDIRHQVGIFAVALALALPLDQAGHVKPGGIERLQDVVARGGDEPGLGDIGVVGFRLGALELGIEPRQFAGALAHAPLQRRIGALQRFGRLHARRDVGKSRHQAAVGHAVRPHLDHQGAFGEALEEGLDLGGVFGDALGDEFVDGPGAALAVPGDVAQDVVERDADAGQFVRQIEDFAELPVPADQHQVLVEYRDALADVIERGLQDFAVVVDRRIGVVEQFQRGLGRDRALAQHQRQHEPRRCRPDRRGQQIFGILQELEVGLGRRLEADAARRREACKGSAGTLLAEIAGDGRDQLPDADRGAAEPETRRHRRQRRGHEQIRLHPLDRGRCGGRASSRYSRRC